MAIQTINIGNIVNDGLGDDLRTAFEKVNANFAELATTSSTTASNVGGVGVGVFKQKRGADLEFKKLVAGNQTFITEAEDTIVISGTVPAGFTGVITEQGAISAEQHPNITLQGSKNLDVTASSSVITIQEKIDTVRLISNIDFGPISGQYENAVQFILAGGDYDFGTYAIPSEFEYDAGNI